MRPSATLYLFFLSTLLASGVLPGVAQAQVERIIADRPDQSQGPGVVPLRTVQLEAGFFYQKQSQHVKIYAYPTALLRYGLLQGVELRLHGAMKDSVIENGTSRKITGFGPVSIGTKVRLWEASGWRPEAALLAMLALPVGSGVFRPEYPEPQFNLGLANELSEKMDLTYNLGYGWTGGDPVPSYGFNIARELINKLTLYVEVYGSKKQEEPAEHQVDLGLLYLLLPNLQFDVAAGRRVNKEAPYGFLAFGFAARLPR